MQKYTEQKRMALIYMKAQGLLLIKWMIFQNIKLQRFKAFFFSLSKVAPNLCETFHAFGQ